MGEHFKRRAHHRPATEIGEGIGGIVEQFSAETSHRAGPGQHRPLEFIRAVEHRYPSCSRSEEHTSELQSLMRISYAVFCFNKPQAQPCRTTNRKITRLNSSH